METGCGVVRLWPSGMLQLRKSWSKSAFDAPATYADGPPGVGPLVLAALLSDRAAATPAAPVLLAPGRPPLSYERLWELVQAVAGLLGGFGIGPGDAVVLLAPDGPEAASAFLAVAAVAACAPLNPAQRRRELDARLS